MILPLFQVSGLALFVDPLHFAQAMIRLSKTAPKPFPITHMLNASDFSEEFNSSEHRSETSGEKNASLCAANVDLREIALPLLPISKVS